MPIVVEPGEAADKVPHLLVRRVKDMRAVDVIFDAGGRVDFRMGVAAGMAAFFEDQDRKRAFLDYPSRHGRTKEAGADNDQRKFGQRGGVLCGCRYRHEIFGFQT